MRKGQIEIRRSKSLRAQLFRHERFYWRLRDLGNNQLVARGTQNYANYGDARDTAVAVCTGTYDCEPLPPPARGR